MDILSFDIEGKYQFVHFSPPGDAKWCTLNLFIPCFQFLKPYFSFFCLSRHSWNWQPVIFYIFDVFFLFFFCLTKGPQTRHWFYFWSEADDLICKYDHLRDFIVWGEKLWAATRGLSQRGWKCLIRGKCVFSSSEILKNAIFKESLTVEKLLKKTFYTFVSVVSACLIWMRNHFVSAHVPRLFILL